MATTRALLPKLGDIEIHDDQVYFCGDASHWSYACSLKDDDTMSEQAVVDYIKHSNRKLFDRLQGLPFPSDHIPQSLHGQRLIHRSQHIVQPAYQHHDQNSYITMLDGTEDSKHVVAMAEKKGLNSVLPVDGFVPEYPTNSKEAIALRKRKWMDIESVLSDVDRESQKRSKMQKVDASDSLIIGGPWICHRLVIGTRNKVLMTRRGEETIVNEEGKRVRSISEVMGQH